MGKVKRLLFATLFAAVICTCGLLVIGYAPNEHHHTPPLSFIALSIAFPIVLFVLLFVRKEIQFHSVWLWTFSLFASGTFIWLLIGMFVFDMGNYHCECEFCFLCECDIIVACVDRYIGALLLTVFALGWIILSQKPEHRSIRTTFIISLTLLLAAICLGLFLFVKTDAICVTYGG